MKPRQWIMERIGSEGCYFLSIVAAAERLSGKRIDAVEVYETAVENNWMHADCFVINPARIMEYMVGGTWSIRHDHRAYKPAPGEILIHRYERKDTMKTWAHFVLAGSDGNLEYDPYGDSRTVREGQLVSSRVLTRIS
jgi:hypothetical protein